MFIVNAIQQLTDIQRHTLEHHTHLVCHEIDLSRGVPDMLFERNIIDIDDHDAIDDTERKKEKREKMMQILFDKENDDWIPHLIQILCETGHNNLVDDLRCFQNGQGGKPALLKKHKKNIYMIGNIADLKNTNTPYAHLAKV